jgi:hypothetical protein
MIPKEPTKIIQVRVPMSTVAVLDNDRRTIPLATYVADLLYIYANEVGAEQGATEPRRS